MIGLSVGIGFTKFIGGGGTSAFHSDTIVSGGVTLGLGFRPFVPKHIPGNLHGLGLGSQPGDLGVFRVSGHASGPSIHQSC